MSPSLGRSKFRLPIQLYFVAPLFAIALSGSTCGVNPTPQLLYHRRHADRLWRKGRFHEDDQLVRHLHCLRSRSQYAGSMVLFRRHLRQRPNRRALLPTPPPLRRLP